MVADWSHIQELDYKQLPFKCRYCHGHGHFVICCKKKDEEEAEKSKEQWTQAQKTASTKTNSRKKGKETTTGFDVPEVRQEQEKGNRDHERTKAEENPFETLRVEEDITETVIGEIEQQPPPSAIEKEMTESTHP